MLTHQLIEDHINSLQPALGKAMVDFLSACVQIDCGPIDDIPIGRGSEFFPARAPFPSCLLQFEHKLKAGGAPLYSLVLWEENPDGGAVLTLVSRRPNKTWASCLPREIGPYENGRRKINCYFPTDQEHQDAVEIAMGNALNLFYILGCSNVTTIDHEPPAALNKKRVARGKLPIHSHKTLVLVIDQPKTQGPCLGGTHASPRVHLRRGHIRRLDEQRRVWVQPCVVGSAHGIVTKDYRITTSKKEM